MPPRHEPDEGARRTLLGSMTVCHDRYNWQARNNPTFAAIDREFEPVVEGVRIAPVLRWAIVRRPESAARTRSHRGKSKADVMAVPDQIKKLWIEIQKKYDDPVNAIGVRIDPRDSATLKVWRDEGIDQFRRSQIKPPVIPLVPFTPDSNQEPVRT